MVILGIDPGYGRCGVAVLSKDRTKDVLIFSTCIETAAAAPFSSRLVETVHAIEELIEEYRPDRIALEKLYFTKNQKTAMHVAEVRGAILYLAGTKGLPVDEYGPGEIKAAVTGDGGADKKQMIHMVSLLTATRKEIRHDDEYDAIAVALTASACVRL